MKRSARCRARGEHWVSVRCHQWPHSVPEVVLLTLGASAGEGVQGTVGGFFKRVFSSRSSLMYRNLKEPITLSLKEGVPHHEDLLVLSNQLLTHAKSRMRQHGDQPEAIPCRPGARHAASQTEKLQVAEEVRPLQLRKHSTIFHPVTWSRNPWPLQLLLSLTLLNSCEPVRLSIPVPWPLSSLP